MNTSAAQAILGLEHLDPKEQTNLLKHAFLRTLPAFAKLTLPYAQKPKVFLVLSGTADVVYQDIEGHSIPLGQLKPGMVIGYDVLDIQHPMTAVVTPVEDMVVLQWSLDWILEHIADLSEWNAWLHNHYMQQRVLITLSRVPLFNSLALEDRVTISRSLHSCRFERDEVVFEQGSPGSSLYLIAEGQFVVERDGKLVATLEQGDFFGEMALISNAEAPHNATVRAYTPARCLKLPGDEFHNLLSTRSDLQAALRAEVDRRLARLERIRQDPRQQEHLAVAVEHGVFRGTHILVRIPALCPEGCRMCEEACTQRFGQSRIKLNGAQIDMWDITTSCRQCRIGAECVDACPEDAIKLEPNGAFVITEACTGCGDCVPACPYDVIELKSIQLEEKTGPLWTLWRRLQGQQQNPRFIANKCDFCAGHDDLACLSICPTESLRLIPIEELFSF